MEPTIITIGLSVTWYSTGANGPLSDAGNGALQEMMQLSGLNAWLPWPRLAHASRRTILNSLEKGAEFYMKNTPIPQLAVVPLSVELPLSWNGIGVVETNYQTPGKHVLEFYYLTGALTLVSTVGASLVVAPGNQLAALRNNERVETIRIDLAPNVWIASTQFG